MPQIGDVAALTVFGQFIFGLAGSLAFEIVSASVIKTSEAWCLPPHYKKLSFWLVRIAVACVAGGLAVAYAAQSAILCIHIGVSTPVIFQTFAKSAPDA